jgi:hypothetical protein
MSGSFRRETPPFGVAPILGEGHFAARWQTFEPPLTVRAYPQKHQCSWPKQNQRSHRYLPCWKRIAEARS